MSRRPRSTINCYEPQRNSSTESIWMLPVALLCMQIDIDAPTNLDVIASSANENGCETSEAQNDPLKPTLFLPWQALLPGMFRMQWATCNQGWGRANSNSNLLVVKCIASHTQKSSDWYVFFFLRRNCIENMNSIKDAFICKWGQALGLATMQLEIGSPVPSCVWWPLCATCAHVLDVETAFSKHWQC